MYAECATLARYYWLAVKYAIRSEITNKQTNEHEMLCQSIGSFPFFDNASARITLVCLSLSLGGLFLCECVIVHDPLVFLAMDFF